MDPDDGSTTDFTYNELTNDEKAWLARNGYAPGELSVKEVRDQMADDSDSDDNSEVEGEIADEVDGTDADAS